MRETSRKPDEIYNLIARSPGVLGILRPSCPFSPFFETAPHQTGHPRVSLRETDGIERLQMGQGTSSMQASILVDIVIL